MNIREIYHKYNIPPNLQLHMLRVAAVGYYIAQNIETKNIDVEVIIKTLLLHDMGNIIKFDFSNTALLGEEKNRIEYWRTVQSDFIQKYGGDEHTATESIAKELGVDNYIIYIISNRGSSHIHSVLNSNDWNLKISSYADFRVDPFGVVSVDKRFDDIKARYKKSTHVLSNIKKTKEKRRSCLLLEKQIQRVVSFDLNDIDNKVIEPVQKMMEDYAI